MDLFCTWLPFAGRWVNVLSLIGLGFGVAVLAGFFGVGGGWVVTPALYALGFPYEHAVGTGFANMLAQSALATVKHRRMGHVDWKLGLTVGALMTGGVEVGKRLLSWLTRATSGEAGEVVGWAYVGLLGALALYVLWESLQAMRLHLVDVHSRAHQPSESVRALCAASTLGPLGRGPAITLRSCGLRVPLLFLLALSLGTGLMAGVMGVGGGFVLVPAFVYLLGVPTLVAVGSSLLCVTASAAYGTYAFGGAGKVDLVAALWMIAGASVGTQIGAAATRRVRGHGIRLLYGLMLLVAAVGVVMKQLSVWPDSEGRSRLAPMVIIGGALLMCVVIIVWALTAAAVNSRKISSPSCGTGLKGGSYG